MEDLQPVPVKEFEQLHTTLGELESLRAQSSSLTAATFDTAIAATKQRLEGLADDKIVQSYYLGQLAPILQGLKELDQLEQVAGDQGLIDPALIAQRRAELRQQIAEDKRRLFVYERVAAGSGQIAVAATVESPQPPAAVVKQPVRPLPETTRPDAEKSLTPLKLTLGEDALLIGRRRIAFSRNNHGYRDFAPERKAVLRYLLENQGKLTNIYDVWRAVFDDAPYDWQVMRHVKTWLNQKVTYRNQPIVTFKGSRQSKLFCGIVNYDVQMVEQPAARAVAERKQSKTALAVAFEDNRLKIGDGLYVPYTLNKSNQRDYSPERRAFLEYLIQRQGKMLPIGEIWQAVFPGQPIDPEISRAIRAWLEEKVTYNQVPLVRRSGRRAGTFYGILDFEIALEAAEAPETAAGSQEQTPEQPAAPCITTQDALIFIAHLHRNADLLEVEGIAPPNGTLMEQLLAEPITSDLSQMSQEKANAHRLAVLRKITDLLVQGDALFEMIGELDESSPLFGFIDYLLTIRVDERVEFFHKLIGHQRDLNLVISKAGVVLSEAEAARVFGQSARKPASDQEQQPVEIVLSENGGAATNGHVKKGSVDKVLLVEDTPATVRKRPERAPKAALDKTPASSEPKPIAAGEVINLALVEEQAVEQAQGQVFETKVNKIIAETLEVIKEHRLDGPSLITAINKLPNFGWFTFSFVKNANRKKIVSHSGSNKERLNLENLLRLVLFKRLGEQAYKSRPNQRLIELAIGRQLEAHQDSLVKAGQKS